MKRKRSIRQKIVFLFLCACITVMSTNLFLDITLNQIISRMDQVYESNLQLNHFTETITKMNDDLYQYLYFKKTVSLESFYQGEKDLEDAMQHLDKEAMRNQEELLAINICNLARSYIDIAEDAILGKRARNIQKYREAYDKAARILNYVQTNVNTLGTLQLNNNSKHYEEIRKQFKYIEIIGLSIAIGVVLIQIIIITILTRNITSPLSKLSKISNEIAEGNFNKDFYIIKTGDEIETLSKAMHKMIISIREYMIHNKESMEKENAMNERELLMEKHLIDTKLRYLQAQVNPHFLFNSLNTGMQLAILEDAERTAMFIEKLAEFYRYNITKDNIESTLEDEMTYVDYYMYILDVRFMGSILYEKNIDTALLSLKVPSMIIQPLVENAVKHGIQSVDNTGKIIISIQPNKENGNVSIIIEDDGKGITHDKIENIFSEDTLKSTKGNGIGIQNIIKRLELYYNLKPKELFHIISEGKGTKIILNIPKKGM